MGLTAIVLAAGRSTRMQQGNKLLLPWGEKRIVQAVVETLLEVPLAEVVVVTGHQCAEVAEVLRGYALRLVHNPHYAEGLSTSIRAGVEVAASGGYLFALGDMPRLKGETVVQLCNTFFEYAAAIVVPTANGQRGNPVVFASCYREELLDLEGDRGAKSLLQKYADRMVEVEVEDQGIFVDVDTPEAYQKAVEEGGLGR